jgi:hypothetical protein
VCSVLSPAALFVAPVYAQNTAQTPGSEAVEEIVVTGIRESLNKARDIKRDATQFVDAIVADDIGKLPDRNVAESLARVSGVQVDRGIAEGTSVSVRGLRQNVYLFNGRQIIDPTGRGGIGLETLGTSTFGLLALVLAAIGLYVLLAYGVTRRTQEIGVRLALGARKRDILTQVLVESATLSGLGAALGTLLVVVLLTES